MIRPSGISMQLLRLAVTLLLTGMAAAQVQTNTQTTAGQATKEVTVDRGEVFYVAGNDLFVKMEDGQIRDFPNIPETARVTVDGRELGIHELKPGMKLERTITTTTTPEIVTTVQNVTGKVWQVHPPSTLILTMENGQNQEFTVPEGQKFMVNGEEASVFDLRKGMVISATKVTEVPESSVARQSSVTGTMPDLPPSTAILIMRIDVTAPMPRETPPKP